MEFLDLLVSFDWKVYDCMLSFHRDDCAFLRRLRLELEETIINSASPAEALTASLMHFMCITCVYKVKSLSAKAAFCMSMPAAEFEDSMRKCMRENYFLDFESCQCTVPVVSTVYGAHTQ